MSTGLSANQRAVGIEVPGCRNCSDRPRRVVGLRKRAWVREGRRRRRRLEQDANARVLPRRSPRRCNARDAGERIGGSGVVPERHVVDDGPRRRPRRSVAAHLLRDEDREKLHPPREYPGVERDRRDRRSAQSATRPCSRVEPVEQVGEIAAGLLVLPVAREVHGHVDAIDEVLGRQRQPGARRSSTLLVRMRSSRSGSLLCSAWFARHCLSPALMRSVAHPWPPPGAGWASC